MKIILIIIINILIINNIYSRESLKRCEDYLILKQYNEAILSANIKKIDASQLFCRAQAKYALKDFNGAKIDFEEVSNNNAVNIENRYLSFLYISKIYVSQNKDTEGLKILMSKLDNLTNTPAIRRLYLSQISEIYLINKDYNQSIEFLNKSLKLAANDNERAADYKKLGALYTHLNNFDKSIEFNLKASLAYERLGLIDEFMDTSFLQVNGYILLNNLSKADEVLKRLEKISIDSDQNKFLAYIDFYQSVVFKRSGNNIKAEESLKRAKQKALDYAIELPEYK